MRTDQTTVEAEHQERGQTACIHHWVIDPPEGLTSLGVCRNCGVYRMFKNFLEADILYGDRYFSSPDVSSVHEQLGVESRRFF